jgi:hypothetical protein
MGNTLIKWIVTTSIISAIAVSALMSAGFAVVNQFKPARAEKEIWQRDLFGRQLAAPAATPLNTSAVNSSAG